MSKKTLMKYKDININDVTYTEKSNQETKKKDNKPVAIIGMSGRVGRVQNMEELWELLVNGREEYRNLPEGRQKDVNDYLKFIKQDIPTDVDQYLTGSVMDNISSFDYRFFSMSLQEARRIDPNQRIFLETAWSALEDAGYAGENIDGSNTGVYVGFSSDFGENYRSMLREIEPQTPATSIVGNINSIIASRISYQLNMRGPAILVDSACSSGLVAVYEAFRAIQSNECSMAIAGSVKCNPLPIYPNNKSSIGIKTLDETRSSDSHTRTFDNASNGTTHAEGAFAFVLKPLEKAQRDGDHIRAVIVGGAINQDGASNGITAPNMAAQEELIKKALKDSKVKAEDISYIEAHGTGTKLGDPIEVGGIQRAFANLTSKKQFCAIGTIKSNVGHMDNASGVSGLAKVVLSMEHRELPASLNFNKPNKNIPFITSPVYVNDRLTPWGKEGEDLYAGINSFGLAGTNCHIILKSAPAEVRGKRNKLTGKKMLTLSAKSLQSLKELAGRYHNWFKNNTSPIEDVLYTLYVGRMHFNTRLAVLFYDYEDLCTSLLTFANSGFHEPYSENIKYGEFSVVIGNEQKKSDNDITGEEQKLLANQASFYSRKGELTPSEDTIEQLAELYVKGAVLPWEWICEGRRKRISLPSYPFTKSRCWIEIPENKQNQREKYDLLRDKMVEVPGNYIFTSTFCPENFWELNEHRIYGVSTIPGTALIEIMVQAICKITSTGARLIFKDLIFEQPFTVNDGANKQLSVWIEDIDDHKQINIYSRNEDGRWIRHVSGNYYKHTSYSLNYASLNLNKIRASLIENLEIVKEMEVARTIIVSNRWTGSYVTGLTNQSKTEFLLEFRLPLEYSNEIQNFHLHPALMDIAINSINGLINEEEVLLPFSYDSLKIYKDLPEHIYVHITRKDSSSDSTVYLLNVAIYDVAGNLVLQADNYCIKVITKLDILKNNDAKYGYKQIFESCPLPEHQIYSNGAVLAAGPDSVQKQTLVKELILKGFDVYIMDSLSKEKDVGKELEGKNFAFGFYYSNTIELLDETYEKWKYEMQDIVYDCIAFVKKLIEKNIKFNGALSLITNFSHKVLDSDQEIHPGLAALTGIWQVVASEYEHLNMRCIDKDADLPTGLLIQELYDRNRRQPLIAYRKNLPYVPAVRAHNFKQYEIEDKIDPNGVIIISGGTGSLGIYLARHLVKKGFRKIVLFGSGIRQKNILDWRDIEEQCEVFMVYGFPIEDYDEVTKKISQIRDDYGYIQGVFHLAGLPGDGYLHNKSMEVFQSVYASKALGAMNLHLATRNEKLKYFVMYSSISSLIFKAGQTDYTGANMALDAISEYRNMLGLPAVSIQWPAWKEIGMAHQMGAIIEDLEFPPIDPVTAMEQLDQILWGGDNSVSVIMPGQRVENTIKVIKKMNSDELNTVKAILVDKDQPDEIEQTIANIWSLVLGQKELSFRDEFTNLGGNSILTSQMLKEYNKKFPQVMDITDLFSYNTIQSQSIYVKSKIGLTSNNFDEKTLLNKKLGDILDQVIDGKISVLETKKLI